MIVKGSPPPFTGRPGVLLRGPTQPSVLSPPRLTPVLQNNTEGVLSVPIRPNPNHSDLLKSPKTRSLRQGSTGHGPRTYYSRLLVTEAPYTRSTFYTTHNRDLTIKGILPTRGSTQQTIEILNSSGVSPSDRGQSFRGLRSRSSYVFYIYYVRSKRPHTWSLVKRTLYETSVS